MRPLYLRSLLVLLSLAAAFGCTPVDMSRNAEGIRDRRPMQELVQEDADAILSGMIRARASQARAGL